MGGGVMSSATKAALFGGFSVASRSAARSPSGTAKLSPSAGQPGLSAALSSEPGWTTSPPVQGFWRPSIDEDWQFADAELSDAFHPTPRLVFGPVPTLEEARQATSDLKDAIDKEYYPAVGLVNSSLVSVTGESSALPPQVPCPVAHAFSLLQKSPEAQNVVASIASDKNVWDAIMKNEKVMEFYKAHEFETNVDPKESVAENEDAEESAQGAETRDYSERSVLSDWMHDVKVKVSKLVSSITDLFKDVMGTSEGAPRKNASTCISTADHYGDNYTYGSSLFALAVVTIIVVLIKRGV